MTQAPHHSITQSLGLYVQIPFCASKCSFCNFSSGVAPSAAFEGYVRAIESEAFLASREAIYGGWRLAQLPVESVYLGGGTPTLLGAELLGRVFGALRQSFGLGDCVEVSVETTPGSADDPLLNRLLNLGANRLSIGAQSFEDRELRSVGRLHTGAEITDQVRRARRRGFRNLSLDLIAGLPYQTLESWRRSLGGLARLEPEHVSIYLFEADENSRLGKQVLRQGDQLHAGAVPDEDFMALAYETACEFLGKEGYAHYEISNFARPGLQSIHNRRYWQRQPYLGLGAGAHSFDGAVRWANETAPTAYQRRVENGEWPIAEKRVLNATEELEEFFFLGLRERQGVSLEHARQRWGLPPFDGWMAKAQRLEQEGFLRVEEGRLSLTERAYLVSNEIFQEFMV